jgi:predicted acylesterase/phospholipase RssA
MTRFQNPRRDCDLVMKGGITSGVVYPQVVLTLAEEYRFRSIGGGSVGAVAAALTAAAELGRERGGFETLEREQKKLRERGFLLKVFRPSEGTRPLMDTLLDLAEARDHAKEKDKSALGAALLKLAPALVRNSPETFIKGTLIGTALGVSLFFAVTEALSSSLSSLSLYLPMVIFGLLFGSLFGLVWVVLSLISILVKRMPRDYFFGMCIGHEPTTPPDRQRLLTDWLADLFNELGGKSKDRDPLTFRDLAEKPVQGHQEGTPSIDLRMLTTNLNQNEPYVFPRKLNTFLFKSDQMRRFFPENVVRYMEDKAALKRVSLPDGFHFLPEGDDLPVIVPVRMGLSFPILLSAVPLWTIKSSSWDEYQKDPSYELEEERDLLQNLFSDGGICSNFPIHLFDAWLPGRPTFGINLTSLPGDKETFTFCVNDVGERRGEPNVSSSMADPVKDPAEPWLPKPDEPDNFQWAEFDSLMGFARAIFYSAQNYRDNMQSRLPSYQERIVQVRLGKDQGGLNLGMDPDAIEDMENKGKKAGDKLCDEFDFTRHQWVRLRVLMNLLETNLAETREGPDLETIRTLVDRQSRETFPFSTDRTKDEHWRTETMRRVELLANLASDWARQPNLFEPVSNEEVQPELRVTPDI